MAHVSQELLNQKKFFFLNVSLFKQQPKPVVTIYHLVNEGQPQFIVCGETFTLNIREELGETVLNVERMGQYFEEETSVNLSQYKFFTFSIACNLGNGK